MTTWQFVSRGQEERLSPKGWRNGEIHGKGGSILEHVGKINVERRGYNCHSSEIQAVSQEAKADSSRTR